MKKKKKYKFLAKYEKAIKRRVNNVARQGPTNTDKLHIILQRIGSINQKERANNKCADEWQFL